jgi:hypothetical protein
LAAERH